VRNISINNIFAFWGKSTSSWRTYLLWLFKGNIVIWASNGVFLALTLLFGYSIVDLLKGGFFTKLTLLETGIVFVLAGAIAFSGSILPSKAREQLFKSEDDEWSLEKLKKSEKSANRYLMLAAVLFVESLVISIFGV
jgi:hypothetical protein